MKKINKTGHKFIVFLVLISLVPLFVTCEEQGGGGGSKDTTYTVIYNKNAADTTGTMENSTFAIGVSKSLPINNFVRNNYCFLGWAKTAASATEEYADGQRVDEDLTTGGKTITLYAVWHEAFTVEVTEGSTLQEKLTWVTYNAESYTTYIIEINSSEESTNFFLSYGAKKNVTIHLKGTGSIGGIGIEDGVTLILDGNLNLGEISTRGGYLIMNGGKISGISSYFYGAVYVENGTFTMNGGEISGNTSSYYRSGVVYVKNGTFTMNDGEISGNTSDGGGVRVETGTFTMNGGKISGNTGGGGVSAISFTMNGGKISGNTGGGGVSAISFTMNGGEISGNTSTDFGGGVSASSFTMKGGEISGNTARNGGGGVSSTGTFDKTGGTITGSNSANGNVVKNSSGVNINNMGRAVYVYVEDGDDEFEKRKETTAGPGDNLSFKWERETPTWSGAWDY
jgi:hypothetical protein